MVNQMIMMMTLNKTDVRDVQKKSTETLHNDRYANINFKNSQSLKVCVYIGKLYSSSKTANIKMPIT